MLAFVTWLRWVDDVVRLVCCLATHTVSVSQNMSGSGDAEFGDTGMAGRVHSSEGRSHTSLSEGHPGPDSLTEGQSAR